MPRVRAILLKLMLKAPNFYLVKAAQQSAFLRPVNYNYKNPNKGLDTVSSARNPVVHLTMTYKTFPYLSPALL